MPTVVIPHHSSWHSLEPPSPRARIPKCAGKQRLAIEERIAGAIFVLAAFAFLPFAHRPSFKHSFSFVALLEGYLTAIQLGRSKLTIRKSFPSSPSRLRLRLGHPPGAEEGSCPCLISFTKSTALQDGSFQYELKLHRNTFDITQGISKTL